MVDIHIPEAPMSVQDLPPPLPHSDREASPSILPSMLRSQTPVKSKSSSNVTQSKQFHRYHSETAAMAVS